MSVPNSKVYLTDIAKENGIKEPNKVLSALIQHDIIFAELDNITIRVETSESGTAERTPPSFVAVKIKEDYLQVILRKGCWSGKAMLSSIIWCPDNPYMPEGEECSMRVTSDDGISIAIEDLFIYDHALADLESRNPEIFTPLINTEEVIEQQNILSNQPIKNLTDPAEIIRQLTEKMHSSGLSVREIADQKALIGALQNESFASVYRKYVKPDSRARTTECSKSGRQACERAQQVAEKKLCVYFEMTLLDRKKRK